MNKLHKGFAELSFRYLILIAVAIPSLWIFYAVFTPLTFYPTYLILNLFFDVMIVKNANIFIINNEIPVEIIRACVAGSAYYLLFALNLATPGIKIEKRVKMILAAFSALLAMNVLRIIFLIAIFFEGTVFFIVAHQIFWYFISTIFVVLIWFSEVKFFKIKEIPFYSDFKLLHKHSLFKR